MKNLLAAFLFLVSWQEYELKDCWITPASYNHQHPDYYTVETVDHSIKLKTQKDVDLFIGELQPDYSQPPLGMSNPPSYVQEQMIRKGGIISKNAVNIKVEEIK